MKPKPQEKNSKMTVRRACENRSIEILARSFNALDERVAQEMQAKVARHAKRRRLRRELQFSRETEPIDGIGTFCFFTTMCMIITLDPQRPARYEQRLSL